MTDLLLLGSLGLSLVDHLLARQDEDLYAAVLGTTLWGTVVSDGLVGTYTIEGHTGAGDLMLAEEVHHTLSATLGETDIVGMLTGAVGMTYDADVGLGVGIHVSSKAGESLTRLGAECSVVKAEEDAAVKGDTDRLTIVDTLHLSLRDSLLKLLSLLLHVIADEATGDPTDDAADEGTCTGITCGITDAGTDGSTCGSTGTGTEDGLVHILEEATATERDAEGEDGCSEDCSCLLHDWS